MDFPKARNLHGRFGSESAHRSFGFRISDFLRISAFEFRIFPRALDFGFAASFSPFILHPSSFILSPCPPIPTIVRPRRAS